MAPLKYTLVSRRVVRLDDAAPPPGCACPRVMAIAARSRVLTSARYPFCLHRWLRLHSALR